MKEITKKLINLGNRAKTAGEYAIANAVFCHIVDSVNSMDELKVSYEDQIGIINKGQIDIDICRHDVYYELACIEDEDGNILSIPVPMLISEVAIAFYKEAIRQGTVIEKRNHNREMDYGDEDEIQALWEELFSLADPEMVRIAAHVCLVAHDTSPDMDQEPTINIISEKCQEFIPETIEE